MSTSNPVTRSTRRYYVEFSVSIAATIIAFCVRHWLLHGPLKDQPPTTQIAVALFPLIPMCFLLAAIVRLIRGTDELFRRICIESLAIAGGMTAMLAVGYGLIEGDQFPYLSAWWSYCVFMVVWIVASFFVRRHYR